jgi:Nitrile hydratase beta subunit
MTTPPRKTEHRDATGHAIHDIGGMDFGAIDRHEPDLALWEKRVDAMMILLYARKQTHTVDAMRRVIEDYGQQAYDKTEYYEKWVRAMRNLLVEQEILTPAEIDARMQQVAATHRASGRTVQVDTVAW